MNEIETAWDLILYPLNWAIDATINLLERVIELWQDMKTWPRRFNAYMRLDNPDHLSAITKQQRRADERWQRYKEQS